MIFELAFYSLEFYCMTVYFIN